MIQDLIIRIINLKVRRAFPYTNYRGVPISDVSKLFIFWITLKQPPIIRLLLTRKGSGNKKDVINKCINRTLFKLKFWPANIVLGLYDWLHWIINFVRTPTKKIDVDILICVSLQKHKLYIEDIANALKRNGKKVEFFNWPNAKSDKHSLPYMSSMPRFWTKAYLTARLSCTFIDYVYNSLKTTNPKKVLVIEGDSYEQHIFGLLKRQFDYDCICLQWGYEPRSSLRMGYRNMPYDSLLVWGSFFEKSFRLHNNNLCIKTVGHPTLMQHKKRQNGKALLFALQRPMVPFVTENDIDTLIELAIESANHFPNQKIIVRNHPNFDIPEKHITNLESIPNIHIHRFHEFSINESLDNAKICISISSTMGFEAIYHGVYPLFVQCNNIPLLLHNDMISIGTGKHITKKINFIETLMQLNSKNIIAPNPEQFFSGNKETAQKKIIKELLLN